MGNHGKLNLMYVHQQYISMRNLSEQKWILFDEGTSGQLRCIIFEECLNVFAILPRHQDFLVRALEGGEL